MQTWYITAAHSASMLLFLRSIYKVLMDNSPHFPRHGVCHDSRSWIPEILLDVVCGTTILDELLGQLGFMNYRGLNNQTMVYPHSFQIMV